MKNLLSITFLIITFLFAGCDKDDDKPSNPIDQLPPATQTGAQTFGCLIDGKAFVPPRFGTNAPAAFYQFVDGAYTLSIYGSTDGGPNLKTINVGCIDMPLIQETLYDMKERVTNSYFGAYLIGGGITFTGISTAAIPGTLIITRFDPANFIISGTFEFTVLDDNGTEIKITDGRFDMQYTN